MAQQILSTNTFTTAKWIVSSTSSDGTHTTIASALTSASSGDTIFIRPGTYTENLTLKAGVNISAFNGDGNTPNVTIIGKLTMTTAGTVSISNIRLQTNSDNILAITGTAASIVNLINCYLNISNNTGISHTSSNAASAITIKDCMGNIGTTGITPFISTSTGTITFNNTNITNTGLSTTASTISVGTFSGFCSALGFQITGTSTSFIGMDFCEMENTAVNATCLTLGSSSNAILNSYLAAGTASAISIGGTSTVINCTISSSNTNAITGAGTIVYAGLEFSSTSSLINTTTKTARNTLTGGISFDGGTNILSTYTEGTFTPTMVGTVAGTTTYTAQNGYYRRIGNLVTIQFTVTGTAATGTGSVVLGGFPFTIKNQTNGNVQGAYLAVNTATTGFPAGTTMATLDGLLNTTTANIFCTGAATFGTQQMANTTFNMQATMSYEI